MTKDETVEKKKGRGKEKTGRKSSEEERGRKEERSNEVWE